MKDTFIEVDGVRFMGVPVLRGRVLDHVNHTLRKLVMMEIPFFVKFDPEPTDPPSVPICVFVRQQDAVKASIVVEHDAEFLEWYVEECRKAGETL